MELRILNVNGILTKKIIKFDYNFFTKKSCNHLLHLEIKRYLLAQRQGTHKTKVRGEIICSTKKLHKQKGTGNARKGSASSPIFKGGGRVFGPKPRKYHIKVNKSIKNKVKKFLIEYKLINNNIIIVEDLKLKVPKTKSAIELVKSIKLNNKKLLLITGKNDNNLYLSFKNLNTYKLLNVDELNCFLLLNYSYIVLFESSINKISNLIKLEKLNINNLIK